MEGCEVCALQKQNKSREILFQNDFWVVVLRSDDQEYLGRCVVGLTEHVPTLAAMTEGHWRSFVEVVKWIESHINHAFSPDNYNWQCLMNLGAADGITHVHWHCVPRYKNPVEFEGESFVDSRWPKSCRKVTPHVPSEDLLLKIVDKIKQG